MKQKIATLLNCYIAELHLYKQFNNLTIQQSRLPGQALVTLLVFVATAMIITTGAVAVTIINSQTTGKFAQGEEVLHIAEAGADNAILRILRDPNGIYTGEGPLAIGSGTVTITVTGSTTKTITAEGASGNFIRKIRVVGDLTNNTFNITSWREID